MSRKQSTTAQLLLEMGVCIEQVQVLKRGLKEHPEEEIFMKGILFFKNESELIMKEITKRQ